MNFNKTSFLHTFLFAIFPIIHLYSINTIEVTLTEIFLPLLISVLLTGIFLVIVKLILKDGIKSGLIVSLMLILTFSYGHLYDWINSEVSEEIGRHSILLPIFLILLLVGSTLIIKTKIKLDNFKIIVNVIAITLIIITIPNFVFAEVSVSETSDELIFSNFQINYEIEKIISIQQEKPDVYYVVFDGYGGTKNMLKDLNYDNYGFLSELSDRGFFAPDSSSSNYPSTIWQMESIFSMNYVPIKEKELSDIEYNSIIHKILRNNEVMRNFHDLDYKIIQYQPNGFVEQEYTYVDQTFCTEDVSNNSKFGITLLRTSILSYLNYLIEIDSKRDGLLCGFSEISKLTDNETSPIFVYMHLAIPHPPYVFDSNGDSVIGGKAQTEEKSFVNKQQYVDTIKFSNKKTLQFIDDILEDNKKSIIILQSDHGYDFGIDTQNPSEIHLKQRFSNLNAILLPEHDDLLYEGMTPVNTFRIIFDAYFDTSYGTIDDKMYYHPYESTTRYKDIDFKDITSIIRD